MQITTPANLHALYQIYPNRLLPSVIIYELLLFKAILNSYTEHLK